MSALLETLLADEAKLRDTMLDELTNDELVHVLEANADALDAAEARAAAARDLRLAIYQVTRGRDPKVTQKRLAEASRVTESFVIQTQKKAREAAAS